MSDFILDAINEAELTLDCVEAGEDVYVCTLASPRGRMKRRMTMKAGHGEPSIGEFLFYFAVIAQLADEAEDITDWAEIHGKDLSAPNVVNEFTHLVADQRDLEIVMGTHAYDGMMAGLAVSQAIGNAMPR